MKQYLELFEHLLTWGEVRPDHRVPNAISTLGCQIRFDLSEGFPLITARPFDIDALIEEVLWTIVECKKDVRWLRDPKHPFWDTSAREDCKLGKGHGYQLRHIEFARLIDPPAPCANQPYVAPSSTAMEITPEPNKFGFVGQSFSTIHCGDFTVIREIPPGGVSGGGAHTKFEIQFVKTGYCTLVDPTGMRTREIRDPWYPRVCGVGYLGNYDSNDPHHKSLYRTWSHMLARCYNPKNIAFADYGGAGLQVGVVGAANLVTGSVVVDRAGDLAVGRGGVVCATG